MLTFSAFEKQIAHLPADQVEVILEIRNIVARLVPDATERFDRYGITYYDGKRGGPVRAGICQVLYNPDQLLLAFIHGKFMPDPHHHLQGDLLAKRFMILGKFDGIPWEDVVAFITWHAHFDPITLAR